MPSRCRSASPSMPGSGLRTLAAAGATADPSALDAWLRTGRRRSRECRSSPARWAGLDAPPPRCRAGWPSRSIRAAMRCSGRSARWPNWLTSGVNAADVRRIELRTPAGTVVPLIHHRPDTGLEGKFSLEYAAAAALLDGYPGFASFTDEAVRRAAARRLVEPSRDRAGAGRRLAARRRAAGSDHTGNGAVAPTRP